MPGVAGEENGYLTGPSRFPFPIFPSFAIFYQKKKKKKLRYGPGNHAVETDHIWRFVQKKEILGKIAPTLRLS